MPASSYSLLLNGVRVDVADEPPQTMLLPWLRERHRLTGTKEGCAEGDCGACTVVIAERDGDAIAWKPINACIRPLASLAGKAVFTVESLKDVDGDGALHPVQQALVDAHGSQCGFCTPGFAMSLFALYKQGTRPSRAAVDDALSGNLCRCTGYRPILAAAQRMHDYPAPAGWRASGGAGEGALAEALRALPAPSPEYAAADQRWIAPQSEDDLATALAAHPDARIVAGATDVGLWVTKQHRDLGTVVSTLAAGDLATVERTASHLVIGAAATLADAFPTLAGEYPEIAEIVQRFASVPIRHAATLGGNVANGSPIGDSMPVLLALCATLVLRHGDRRREVPIDGFYTGYRRNVLQPGELLTRIRVPLRSPGLTLRAYKISKRYDQDISAVLACFALSIVDGVVREARIGCGGVAATPVRAKRTEAALAGQPWTEATARRAASVLAGEFQPIDDMRASAGYRREVLGNLVLRLWYETNVDAGPATRVHALDEAAR
jgi:xanthine dehydrogenase small subunit